jgi:integrase
MKAGRAHRVPLSQRSLDILNRTKELAAGSEYVFPGRSGTKPMSNMVFLMALRRRGLQITAHGFRSSFRDWASECTHFPREVCELALAHTIKALIGIRGVGVSRRIAVLAGFWCDGKGGVREHRRLARRPDAHECIAPGQPLGPD